MMPAAEIQNIFQLSQIHLEKKEFEMALKMLEGIDCVMGCWRKGSIYLAAAEDLSNSFNFKYYVTDDLKNKYRKHLNDAYDSLCKAAQLLHSASQEIKDFLNTQIWYQIGKVENELARTRPEVEEEAESYYDETIDYQQQYFDTMMDELSCWNL